MEGRSVNPLFVSEFRFFTEEAEAISRIILRTLAEHGYDAQDYDHIFHAAREAIKFESRQTADDKPSGKQVSFARKLWHDLRHLVKTEGDEALAAKAQLLLSQIQEAMKAPEVSKKEASEAIGALKEAADELTFSQKGINTKEW